MAPGHKLEWLRRWPRAREVGTRPAGSVQARAAEGRGPDPSRPCGALETGRLWIPEGRTPIKWEGLLALAGVKTILWRPAMDALDCVPIPHLQGVAG